MLNIKPLSLDADIANYVFIFDGKYAKLKNQKRIFEGRRELCKRLSVAWRLRMLFSNIKN